MRLINILILVFLLAAFSVGISLKDAEMTDVNQVLDNASAIATNFSLQNVSDNPYVEGGFLVGEKFVHFALVAAVEVMRMGILFGHDNPEYFDAQFILSIAKMIIWLTILSLLFVPLMSSVAFLMLIMIWVIDKVKRRNLVR